MENDLIRRSEVLNAFDGIYDCCDLVFETNDKCCDVEDCAHCKFYPIKRALRKLVEQATAVDAVEVVRCRDCAVPHNEMTGCPLLLGIRVDPDFYCKFGYRERREEAGT